MEHARRCLVVITALLASASSLAETRSFRCKQDLVQLGDSKSTTLSRCGEPVMKDSAMLRNSSAMWKWQMAPNKQFS